MDLESREWGEFKLDTVFEIENCKCNKVSALGSGKTPYVGATNRDNGVMSFVECNEPYLTKGNCIAFICDGEGSMGLSVYRKSYFIGSTTVKVGRNKYLNEYIGQFITTVADKVRFKYNFGFKRNTQHLKNEILLLPMDNEGKIDYTFMESYMKEKEREKLERYKNYIVKRLEELRDYEEVEPLEEKEWGEFVIEDLFAMKIGKNVDGNKINKQGGKVAYVTRKETDNGLDGFISYGRDYINSSFPVITIGNETAKPFVQQYPFFTGTKVNILSHKSHVSLECYKFMAQCLEMHKSKYSYSFTVNSTRLRRQKIMLPMNNQNQPDYNYMENYMKRLEYKKLKSYLGYKQIV